MLDEITGSEALTNGSMIKVTDHGTEVKVKHLPMEQRSSTDPWVKGQVLTHGSKIKH